MATNTNRAENSTSSAFRAPHDDLRADAGAWAECARELHDGVTQEVWYLQAELSALAQRLPDSQEGVLAEINRLCKVAQDAYQELRETINHLSARGTGNMDLAAELRELVSKFSETLGMEVDFKLDTGQQAVVTPARVTREVRRLVQEALWNSWRHSMSRRASVSLRRSRIGLIVTISDDGCGFQAGEAGENHYGLRNMRERAEDIGGKLYVASGTGKGTRVTLHLPTDTLESMKQGVTQ